MLKFKKLEQLLKQDKSTRRGFMAKLSAFGFMTALLPSVLVDKVVAATSKKVKVAEKVIPDLPKNSATLMLTLIDKNGRKRDLARRVGFNKPITLNDDPKDIYFEQTMDEANKVDRFYKDDRQMLEYLAETATGTIRRMLAKEKKRWI